METGEIGIIVTIVIGVGAVLWQIWAQGGRLDRRIDSVEKRIETEADRLDRKVESEGGKLDRKVESEIGKLDRRIGSIEDKVSDAALAAARNEGRYDVLTAQTHTHESSGVNAD